jgi:hypothetical protein
VLLHKIFFFSFVAQRPYSGPGCLIVEASRSHKLDTPYFVGTTLDEGSVRRRDFCLKIYDIHKREAPMPPVGFETAIPLSERSQTRVLVRAEAGIGIRKHTNVI